VKRFPIIIILAAVVAGGQADATQRGLMAATKVEPRLLEKIYATCGEVGERDSIDTRPIRAGRPDTGRRVE
jgi:hypothetical protein